jgi:hypothetical protein
MNSYSTNYEPNLFSTNCWFYFQCFYRDCTVQTQYKKFCESW